MTKTRTTKLDLTDEQLAALCERSDLTDEQREAADRATARVAVADVARSRGAADVDARFVAAVIDDGRTEGRLAYYGVRSEYRCDLCGARPDPILYKSGRRRGEVKTSGSHVLMEHAERFVRITGYASLGCCKACAARVHPLLVDLLATEAIEVPQPLAAEGRPAFKRQPLVTCECGWSGHEGEMLPMPTLLDRGTYPGKCPSCSVEKVPFGRDPFTRLGGFVVVAPEAT